MTGVGSVFSDPAAAWLTRCVVCCSLLLLAVQGFTSSPLEQTGTYGFPEAQAALVGQLQRRDTVYEDTLAAIARQTGVGFAALKRANPQVDPWLPGAATTLVLPTAVLLPPGPREGLVVNLAERRLFYFDRDHDRLLVYPVGIGRRDFPTPTVTTETVLKIHQPSWTPTASIRREHAARGEILPQVVPPGPDNPMGDYAIKLAAPGLFIHGTNRPLGVGGRVSHGCLRLYPEHIRRLATGVPRATPVRIVDEPYKVAWHGDHLYLEAHPDEAPRPTLSRMVQRIIEATRDRPAAVDWALADATARAARGIPIQIGSRQATD